MSSVARVTEIEDGKVTAYKVNMLITFILE